MKNKFELEVRVTRPVKVETGGSGKKYARLSLECESEGRKQYFNPTVWESLAEEAGELKEGDMIEVSGNLYMKGTPSPIDPNKKVYSLDMSIKEIKKAGGKKKEEKNPEPESSQDNDNFDFEDHLNQNENKS